MLQKYNLLPQLSTQFSLEMNMLNPVGRTNEIKARTNVGGHEQTTIFRIRYGVSEFGNHAFGSHIQNDDCIGANEDEISMMNRQLSKEESGQKFASSFPFEVDVLNGISSVGSLLCACPSLVDETIRGIAMTSFER